MSTIEQDIANVRHWHPNPPEHDCPSRSYMNLANAIELQKARLGRLEAAARNAEQSLRIASRFARGTLGKRFEAVADELRCALEGGS